MDLHKRKCAIKDCFVYSVHKNIIIKHNLFTKRSYVIFRTNNIIENCYISKKNIIVYTFEHCIYWNNVIVNSAESFSYLRHIKVRGNRYVTSFLNDKLLDRSGKKLDIKIPYFTASLDGKKIVYESHDGLYKQCISNVLIKGLFCVGAKHIRIQDQYYSLRWIPNSDYILINDDMIIDVNNCREMIIKTSINRFFVFYVRGLIVIHHNGFVEIYDSNKMVFVQRIDTDLIFTDYNQLLNVLVTHKRECFRLKNNDSKYRFQKVILGINYILDHKIVPKNIETIIDIFNITILYEISNDVLFVELYQQLLQQLSY